MTGIINEVLVNLTEPQDMNDRYFKVSNEIVVAGNEAGVRNNGANGWFNRRFPSTEKMRIWKAPEYRDGILRLDVTPYHWSEIQAHRELAESRNVSYQRMRSFYKRAIALTANAFVLSKDGHLILHKKKGGAWHGQLHTFGGYVERIDLDESLEDKTIRKAIARELTEKSELGLRRREFKLRGLFGTPEGLPSFLWDFGTAAVYGYVETNLNFDDFKGRIGDESLDNEVYAIPLDVIMDENKLDKWLAERKLKIHSQTEQVFPTIREMLN